jgi:hypothetical protein
MIQDLLELSREAFRLAREDPGEASLQEKFERHFETLMRDTNIPDDMVEAVAEAFDHGRLEAFQEAALTTPLYCAHCNEAKRAVCVGTYEGEGTKPACNDCCAHGNEDGHCEKLPDILPQYESRSRGVIPRSGTPHSTN